MRCSVCPGVAVQDRQGVFERAGQETVRQEAGGSLALSVALNALNFLSRAKPLAKGWLRWTDQANLSQEGPPSNVVYDVSPSQAKTTKKIVLKLECTKCKAGVVCLAKNPQNFKCSRLCLLTSQAKRMKPIKRTKHFELGTDSKKGSWYGIQWNVYAGKNEYGGKYR